MAKFMHGSQLKWDDALPLVIYCYNIALSVDDLESSFYLVHDRDSLEGTLSNLQNYCNMSEPSLANQQYKSHGKCGNSM